MTREELMEQAYQHACNMDARSAPWIYRDGERRLVILVQEMRQDPMLTWWVYVRDEDDRFYLHTHTRNKDELRQALKKAVLHMNPEGRRL